jgi:hypothetical protein
VKFYLLVPLLFLAVPCIAQQPSQSHQSDRRWTQSQKYAANGFEPLHCFAGQVKIRGKQIREQPFSVFVPNGEMKCCGTLLKSGRTDEHGHFLLEPMQEGEYFTQFEFKGVQYITNFAVIDGYQRCDGTHVEIDFSDAKKAKIQSFVDINDSGEGCRESEPQCYRK